MRNEKGQFGCGSKHLVTHGYSKTPIYAVWRSMRTRCDNPKCKAYPNYGGRGIAVCERWETFSNFLADMGERPEGMTLDRIDNDGPYSPENCRWTDRTTQGRNRRACRQITVMGETLTLSEWAERSGNSIATIWARLNKGWDPLPAVFGRKVPRKGLKRGTRLRNHVEIAYGAEHGVRWSDEMGEAA